jgi:hypothetical protein
VRLWYKLNERPRIQVRTGVGMSEECEVGAVLGQGTLGGALISQAVLDDGVTEQFQPGGGDELEYGSVPLAPVMFQDDLAHGARELEGARIASKKVNRVIKERGLELNEDKSVCIVVGSKKQRAEATKEMKANPLVCGSVTIREVETWKWLGQHMSAISLADSVAKTVAAREGKVRGAALEISQIINDWRAQAVGGMETALMLWESCCVPSLLHGAGTWVDMSAATENKLNDLQRWFLRLVLQVGPGAPKAALGWESGLMDMGLRIKLEKVLMVFHLRSLDKSTLARKIYEEQKENKWPGLAKETEGICKEWGIEDCNTSMKTKKEYKELAELACMVKDEANLRKMGEGKEKCSRMFKECYGRKKYWNTHNIKEAREMFRTRVAMMPFAGNYGHSKLYAGTNWLCRCSTAREEERHLTAGECPVYGDLAEGCDFESDNDLKEFFMAVLARRDALDEADREERVT